MPETILDVYCSNLYALSSFYDGDFPFDAWEEAFDNWLRAQVAEASNIRDSSHVVENHIPEEVADNGESCT